MTNNRINFRAAINLPHNQQIVSLIFTCFAFYGMIAIFSSAQDSSLIDGGVTVERLKDVSGRDISVHKQSGIVDNWIEQDLSVVVKGATGNRLEGVKVHFALVSQPAKAKRAKVDPVIALTGANGVARTKLHLGSKAGDYVVTAITTDTVDSPVTFEVDAKPSSWLIFLTFGLLGGLAIFLYGMEIMSNGMKKAAGDQMRGILGALTNVRIIGVLVGVFVTMVIQSSSATTVMLVGFVNARLMSLSQSLGVILGADIGTTVTAQLIAFKLTHYALLIVAVGFIILFVSKTDVYRAAGEALLGFGLVFFGIYIMSEAMYPFRSYQPFIDFLLTLKNPLLGILVGAAFTALIQSSSAFTGILIALAQQGLLSLEASIPLLFGANIGTCITPILASLGAPCEARQVAAAHTFFKVGGVLIFVWLIGPLASLVRLISPEAPAGLTGMAANAAVVPRQIANTHTAFNAALTIIFFPLVPLMARFVEWIMPDKGETAVEAATQPVWSTQHLNTELLSTPVFAIERARREILRMARVVRGMLADIMPAFIANDTKAANDILQQDNQVDYLQRQTAEYLTQITRANLSLQQSEHAVQLLYVTTELEHIGDVIEKNLVTLLIKKAEGDIVFSEEGREEIVAYHQRVLESYDNAIKAFENDDVALARTVSITKPGLVQLEQVYRRTHYDRLRREFQASIDSSQIHLDLIDNLRRINSYSESIASIVLEGT